MPKVSKSMNAAQVDAFKRCKITGDYSLADFGPMGFHIEQNGESVFRAVQLEPGVYHVSYIPERFPNVQVRA